MTQKDENSILKEAETLVDGVKRGDYGELKTSFDRIAEMWSIILGMNVESKQVAQCMIALKQCREVHKHSRDNLIDICGYAYCLDQLVSIRNDGE